MAASDLPYRTNPDYWNGSKDAAALAFGFGDSTNRFQMGDTANQNGLGLFFESLAATGDARGINLRLYFSKAGGSGEALRAYGIVNGVQAAVGGTVNGAHITLGISGGAAGQVSGAGNALRATLSLGASVNPGGTLSGIQIDSDFDNAATVDAKLPALRFTNTNTKVWPVLMEIPNAANGTIFAAHITQVMSHSIKIKSADGTLYYVMCTATATNRS